MAPRSIWRGAITFGLITIPVRIYTAVGREAGERIDLHLLHAKDGERIHYDRTCDKGHKDIDWDEIVKGHEYAKGKWVEITDDDLEALELESLHTIDVVSFAPMEQIDPMYFDKSYYVVPDQSGVKAYRLITQALEDEGLVGVAKVAIREREHLSALRFVDGMVCWRRCTGPRRYGMRPSRNSASAPRCRIASARCDQQERLRSVNGPARNIWVG